MLVLPMLYASAFMQVQLCGGSGEWSEADSSASRGNAAEGWGKSIGRMAGFHEGAQSESSGSSSGGSSSSATGSQEEAQTDFVRRMRSEVARAVLPDWNMQSVMKRHTDVNAREIRVGEGPTDLVVQVSDCPHDMALTWVPYSTGVVSARGRAEVPAGGSRILDR